MPGAPIIAKAKRPINAVFPLRKKMFEQSFRRFCASVFIVLGPTDQSVSIEGIWATCDFVKVKLNAKLRTFFFKHFPHSFELICRRIAKFCFHIGFVIHAILRNGRVKHIRSPSELDGRFELLLCFCKQAVAQPTPGADHIRNDIDLERALGSFT